MTARSSAQPPVAGPSNERGSATVEVVVLTPLLVLLLLFVVALGRLADARLLVADAAHQAARAASLARTEQGARAQAQRAAAQAIKDGGAACGRPQVSVTTDHLDPGSTVRVRINCTAELGDLTRTAMPGHVVLADTAYSVVDSYRSSS
ncbi:TadE/TadG family type IV pilus assembly protein [Actinacidiphila yeochonensis]|uniref:TadE/TadG family type IV pilus assembly protein n=1 Tax=Actinacidiphila yeochonensis TaxID=89050 RepID=UPI00099CA9B0|nr:TadE/TadG family type IV pilus assembly protein [Actinacidiphila yeochonensis]